MLVVPKLLAEALEGLDKRRGCEVGFDFAEHALSQVGSGLGPDYVTCAQSYARAARAYLDGELSRDELVAEGRSIPPVRRPAGSGGGIEVPGVSSYVYVLCLQLETPGTAASKKLLRGLVKEAQLTVAKHAAEETEPQGQSAAKQAFAAARWEEARWQLIHIIATEPASRRGG